jgi:hypothetical protein
MASPKWVKNNYKLQRTVRYVVYCGRYTWLFGTLWFMICKSLLNSRIARLCNCGGDGLHNKRFQFTAKDLQR